MALDGIFLYSLVSEMKEKILSGKVDKVNQPEPDEIVLVIRGVKQNYKLSLSASAVYPKINFTEKNKQNPLVAPMFCMVLRKYLTGSRILDIIQLSTDRVVIMDFESLDEMGFNSIYSLVIEIMGRHSNITLVRKRDNIIMESIKHVTPDMNTVRNLYPGIPFVFPPASDKLNPFNVDFEEFKDYIVHRSVDFDEYFFSKVFTGVSIPLSKEIYHRLKNKSISLSSMNLRKAYDYIHFFFADLKSCNFSFSAFASEDNIVDFHCIKFETFAAYKLLSFDSPSEVVSQYYYLKDKYDRLNSRSLDLQRLLNNNIDRCTKKISILNENLEESIEKDSFRLKGELLTANIYSIKKGDKSVSVVNYYDEESSELVIALDENKTPSENIQVYFKKYNKLKKSEENSAAQLVLAKDELSYLYSVLNSLKNIECYEEIEEIKEELINTGYVKFKKSKKIKKVKSTKPIHIVSVDGIDIYIGKNNLQNDNLTLKFADKHDLWLHTKDIPGSHVIIKAFGQIPDSTLLEAAEFAAYFSKAKESSKVAVDYTEVKNVKKPNGSKPGMVIYTTNKTIYAEPSNAKISKLKTT